MNRPFDATQTLDLSIAQYGQSRRLPERFDADDDQAALLLDAHVEEELFFGALRDALEEGAPLPASLRRL